jgi:hypothetical protein
MTKKGMPVTGDIAFQEQPEAIVVESTEGFNMALRFT